MKEVWPYSISTLLQITVVRCRTRICR